MLIVIADRKVIYKIQYIKGVLFSHTPCSLDLVQANSYFRVA